MVAYRLLTFRALIPSFNIVATNITCTDSGVYRVFLTSAIYLQPWSLTVLRQYEEY